MLRKQTKLMINKSLSKREETYEEYEETISCRYARSDVSRG